MTNSIWKKLMCIPLSGRVMSMSKEEIVSRIHENYVLSSMIDISMEKNWRDRPTKVLRDLVNILQHSNRAQLQFIGPREIVISAVKIFFYFDNIRRNSDGKCDWKRQRNYKISRACYNELIILYVPVKSRQLVRTVVEIIYKEKLWRWEDLCLKIAPDLLERKISGILIIDEFLNRLDEKITKILDARFIVRILYEMLDTYSWPNSKDTVLTVERLLKLYYQSLNDDNAFSSCLAFKKGLEICIRNTINNIDNENLLVVIYRMCVWSIDDKTSSNTILNFGNILEYAAYVHLTNLYKDTLNERIFDVLMQMLSSSRRLVSLLGNRVLQYLLDRQDNRSQFDTPKIFYEGTNFPVKLNRYNRDDKLFLEKKRHILHESLVNSMINHCSIRINLETTYCTICLLAVEVPCGFTAAAIVCLAMNLQDFTLEQSKISRETCFHINATVIAVMSLLCWIHSAKIFYSYVNKIIMERAQQAPHLNPPLNSRYSFAVHHVLWNKPELFFVDWETRYGLWKCFRLREEQRKSSDNKR